MLFRSSRAPLSLRESKRLLNRPLEGELERAFQNEIEAIMRCFGTADAREATVAFREKRPPVFQGKRLRLSSSLFNIMIASSACLPGRG